METYGVLEEEETEEESPLKPKKCPRCSFKNPASNKFCGKCSMALDLKSVMDFEKQKEEEQKIGEITMASIQNDPELQKVIEDMVLKKLQETLRKQI